ncbi:MULTISPECIES: hypothetical protein [unclassified Sphingobium]|uniref:hypothetical protein n=1 Tax=unclassified Sphingobium TaxID=2611147 RepID=UPI0022249FDB|nr:MULTISPECIES: hypothetical protein [unclassified Sphingobium]MCW2412938.1 hypothetical protein [Sphingobium sp. B8D3D]MCW2414764.1 hypothetical protein [Sphingobium sp. B8D3A]
MNKFDWAVRIGVLASVVLLAGCFASEGSLISQSGKGLDIEPGRYQEFVQTRPEWFEKLTPTQQHRCIEVNEGKWLRWCESDSDSGLRAQHSIELLKDGSINMDGGTANVRTTPLRDNYYLVSYDPAGTEAGKNEVWYWIMKTEGRVIKLYVLDCKPFAAKNPTLKLVEDTCAVNSLDQVRSYAMAYLDNSVQTDGPVHMYRWIED